MCVTRGFLKFGVGGPTRRRSDDGVTPSSSARACARTAVPCACACPCTGVCAVAGRCAHRCRGAGSGDAADTTGATSRANPRGGRDYPGPKDQGHCARPAHCHAAHGHASHGNDDSVCSVARAGSCRFVCAAPVVFCVACAIRGCVMFMFFLAAP